MRQKIRQKLTQKSQKDYFISLPCVGVLSKQSESNGHNLKIFFLSFFMKIFILKMKLLQFWTEFGKWPKACNFGTQSIRRFTSFASAFGLAQLAQITRHTLI